MTVHLELSCAAKQSVSPELTVREEKGSIHFLARCPTRGAQSSALTVLLKNCVKISLAIVVIVGMFSAFAAPPNASANEVTVTERRKQLIELYIQNEFSKGNSKLRKFETVGAFAISIECGSLDQSVCQNAKQILDKAFEPSANVRLVPSVLSLITFVFENSAHIEGLLPNAVKDYAGGVSDTSDQQCAIFYSYANSRIEKGKIFVSTDQASKRLYACVVFQIGQLLGPGFSQTDRFLDAWDGLLSRSSDDKLKQIAHIYGILEFMHMCPELVAGMLEVEARRALHRPGGCMSKLEGIN
jgi:hypothetical protein